MVFISFYQQLLFPISFLLFSDRKPILIGANDTLNNDSGSTLVMAIDSES